MGSIAPLGKRGRKNRGANEILKGIYRDKGITYCELGASDHFNRTCTNNIYLGFAHRHKRRWYYDKPDSLISSFSQTLLLCTNCHQRIEYDRELSESVFNELRGEDA